eukprot:767884-Hanusia_phi.AAC.2
MPEIKTTVVFPHIKVVLLLARFVLKPCQTHYLSSHPKLNYYGIIPKGRKVDLDAPHNRHEMKSA